MKKEFNITRAREETPGVKNCIHFNNAGSSLIPQVVLDTVINYLKLESEIGGYEAVEKSEDKIGHVYTSIAELIGCDVGEIAVAENATRAWDMAFYSIPFQRGDKILTCQAEYASNYIAYLQISRKTGAVIEVIPDDDYGQVSIEALKNKIDNKVKLISITHVPTNGGLVNPAKEIGKVARDAGILYLLDACQSVGQMNIDVVEIGCSMMSVTGRKFLRGPRGTGFLYVNKDILEELEPPFLDLHAAEWTARNEYKIRNDARRFENWETNYAGKVGLGAAVEYALEWGLDNIWDRVVSLADLFRAKLSDIPGVLVRDTGEVKCGIVTFSMEKLGTGYIKKNLTENKINVSESVIESTRLDFESRNLPDMIRASLHYFNTEEEIEKFCICLSSFAKA